MIIDSHAHLDDKRFNQDREMIIKNLKNNGIELVVNVGADLKSSKSSVELANKYENIYAVVGIHPHSATQLNRGAMESLKELSKDEKVVAIGEIGLDFYYDNSPRDVQRAAFRAQIELARQLELPIVIHSRDADQETFDILQEAQDGNLKILLHCYSGSVELAEEYLKLGSYLSLAGPVTFKNSRIPKEVAKMIPLDRLLIETDSPYLTPEPYRGKRNEPMFTKYTAQAIADIKGISLEKIASATRENTKIFFNIP